jgi:pimeloyl-ACP methyl ester carboxylesterase
MSQPVALPPQLPLPEDAGAARIEYVEAGGIRFEVYEAGDPASDRLALCLHGFPEHAYSWRHQLPLLARLGYRVWAPNQRGYGNTSRPIGVEHYAIDRLVDDVGALIDAAGCREVTLIGHDWGGVVAWMSALRKVRPIDRLVVMNLPHPRRFAEGLRTLRQIARSWYAIFFQIPRLPEKLLTMRGGRAIDQAFLGMAVNKERFPDEVLEVYRRNALQAGAATAMVNWYRATRLGGLDLDDLRALPRLDTPTLLVWGEIDRALGVELTYGTDALVDDLTVRYLPHASHWVQQDAPDDVNAMLEAWLTGAPVPGNPISSQQQRRLGSGAG